MEQDGERGLTHFLEHLVFKGTKKRTARRIAEELDAVGGHLDAATSREHTCFYARILAQHLPLACDVITDILLNSLLNEGDIDKERGVVLEEIRSVEDDPDDLVVEGLLTALYGDHTLARPVLGGAGIIRSVDRQTLVDFHRRNYISPRITIAAAGQVRHEDLSRLVEPLLSALPATGALPVFVEPVSQVNHRFIAKDIEQAHLALGMPALRFDHPDRYILLVLNNLLGGSVSSRLFQEVREKRGLVYGIYSSAEAFRDSGILVVQTSCEPARFQETAGVVGDVIRAVAEGKFEDSEVERGREQMKGGMFLALEGTVSRMTRLAASSMYLGRVLPLEEVMKRIDAVTPAAVRELAARLLVVEKFASSVVGPGRAEQYRIPWMSGEAVAA
jgi:predicted Zn-dependent peptidase